MDWNVFWTRVWNVFINGGWTLLKLIAIFILGYIIIRIIKKVLIKVFDKSIMDNLAKKFIIKTVVFILYFILLLILLRTAGIEITGLLTTLAAAGLAVALALQNSLTSLANGVILIITKPFKENDSIEVNGISGKVKAIRFFSTVIDTWDNKRVIIPNKQMLDNKIVNNNYNQIRRFSVYFTVNEKTDYNKLKQVVLESVVSNDQVFLNPAPQFLLKEIGDDGLKVEVRGWANSCDCDTVCFAVRETILNELKRNKIDFENKRLIVHLEERNSEETFDSTPLPKRDMTKEPEIKKHKNKTFDDLVDSFTLNAFKSKKKKKQEKPKKK